jgi:hypothetical protein
MSWKLEDLLAGLHDEVERHLASARKLIPHAPSKGDESEAVWLKMLQTYLPNRYCADSVFVIDSKGKSSEQVDIAIFDRQYTPFVYNFQSSKVVPAESIYAVFEAKQTVNANNIAYAQRKISTVRQLHRTSLPVPYVGGTYPPKPLQHIIGGIVTFESDWAPAMSTPLEDALAADTGDGTLDLGCVAAHGIFDYDQSKCFAIKPHVKPATAFLLELIARLQESATVPMIDVRAYAKWLA